MATFTDPQKDELVAEVKATAGIPEDNTDHDDLLRRRLPKMYTAAETYCGQTFEPDETPDEMYLYLADAFTYTTNQTGLKSKKMGDVTITYQTPSEAPDDSLKHLKPFRKVKW